MVPVSKFIAELLTHKGKPYVFGAEASPLDPDPDAFDCSELVEYAARVCGVSPRVPDGAYYQWLHTRNTGGNISVAEAIRTPGALLFMGDGTGVGRNAITHVAVSLGNGLTIEARGSRWGVGVFSAARGFDFAGKLAGIDYRATQQIPAKVPTEPLPYRKGDTGAHVDFVRVCLNLVHKERRGKLLDETKGRPVDDAFTAAVKEWQQFCENFAQYISGGRLHFGGGSSYTATGLPGPITLKALGDWITAKGYRR